MLSFKNSPERGEGKGVQNQQKDTWKNWTPSVKESEICLWVLDEPFEFGVLPMQPSCKISVSLLRKVSAYIKTKNMYPALNLSAWIHISQLKLQMGTHIPWIYLRMFDILKQQLNRENRNVGYWDFRCEQLRKGRKDKKDEFRVPTFEFLIFLYIQNSYKLMKRISAQLTNVGRRQDERSSPKSQAEQKIQNEQLHYQYVHDNIEDIIDYLQEGYKSKEEVPITIIEAINLLFCCTANPRECTMDPLETVVCKPGVSSFVGYDPVSQTVNRTKLVQWIRLSLKLNPWGSASSFIHSPKIYPPSGCARHDSRDEFSQNRIIFNQKHPPHAWAILSNVCHQVFYHDEKQEFTNLKIHRCNNSFIYAPGVYNCVFVDKCVNTTIFLGVTAKVVKFVGCCNVKVYSVGRQVIITDCIKSSFYLLTPCQPILTGGKNMEILVAPYNTHYPRLEQHMSRADLKASVSCWNEPLQIGIDGMTAADTLAPVISFVPPEEFHAFTFPFDMLGNTHENPLPLGDYYQEAFDKKKLEFKEWQENWSDQVSNPNFKSDYESAIMQAFKSWMVSSGTGREVEGLFALKSMLERKSTADDSGTSQSLTDDSVFYADILSISCL